MGTAYDWAPFFDAINNVTNQWGQRSQYQGMIDKLVGSPTTTAPSMGTPAIAPQQTSLNPTTPQLPGQPAPMQQAPVGLTLPGSAATQGTPGGTSYGGLAGQPLGSGAASILPLLRNAPPSVGLPLLLNLATKNAERQQTISDAKITPLSDDEAKATLGAAWQSDAKYGKDISGNVVTIQKGQTISQAAMDQQLGMKKQGGIIDAQNPLTQVQKATISHEGAALAETTRHDKASEYAALHPFGLGGGDTSKTGADFLATMNPGMAAQIKAIGDYRQAPPANRASKEGIALMSMVNAYNPSYDATQYGSKVKARNDFTTGKNGNTVRSLNVAVQHLDQLGTLSDALGNGNVQAANQIGNAFNTQFGGDQATNFNAAKQIVGDEIVKAIVGAGGGVGDREKAQESISAASSPRQLKGVIQTYQGLMSGQIKGLKQQYEKSTGLNDFEGYLAPETQAKLQSHTIAAAPITTPKTVRFQDLP